jgi:PEP-CTERM motif
MQMFTLKRILLCGGVSAIVCLISASSASANLLLNPGFEITNANWGAFNGAVLASTAHPRSGLLSVRLPVGNGIGAFQTITNITASSQFDLTGFGFITNTMTAGFVGIQATFFTSGGVNLGTVETAPGVAIFSNHIDSNSVLNTWIALDTGVFTAPATTAYMQVFPLGVNLGSTGGSSWIDDLDLEAVPEPSTLALGIMGLLVGLPWLARRRKS